MPKKAKMMRATRELVYNTRRMLPGTVFEVDGRYVIRLLATRKAELVREPAVVPPPPPAVAAKIAAAVAPVSPTGAQPLDTVTTSAPSRPLPATSPRPPAPLPAIAAGVTGNVVSGEGGAPAELAAARADYERLLGKKPFHGWDAAALREKIAVAKSSTGG